MRVRCLSFTLLSIDIVALYRQARSILSAIAPPFNNVLMLDAARFIISALGSGALGIPRKDKKTAFKTHKATFEGAFAAPMH